MKQPILKDKLMPLFYYITGFGLGFCVMFLLRR